jgi:hypothetical protein
VALDVHDVASAKVGGDVGHGGRLGRPLVAATGDEALRVIDSVLPVDGGQGVPVRAVDLESVVADRPMLEAQLRVTYASGVCCRHLLQDDSEHPSPRAPTLARNDQEESEPPRDSCPLRPVLQSSAPARTTRSQVVPSGRLRDPSGDARFA